MTAERAINILKSRLTAYCGRPNANTDYIRQTADIINALVELYNENKRSTERLKALPLLLDFCGIDPAVAEVPPEMVADHADELFVNAFTASNPANAYNRRIEWLIVRYRHYLKNIEIAEEMRRTADTIGGETGERIRSLMPYPPTITPEKAIAYLIQQ